MENARPGNAENLDFSRSRAYNGLKIGEVCLPVGDVLERRRLRMDEYLPKGTEAFTLTAEMKPTEAQKQMVQRAKRMPVTITTDCPLIPSEQLSAFTRFRPSRPVTAK